MRNICSKDEVSEGVRRAAGTPGAWLPASYRNTAGHTRGIYGTGKSKMENAVSVGVSVFAIGQKILGLMGCSDPKRSNLTRAPWMACTVGTGQSILTRFSSPETFSAYKTQPGHCVPKNRRRRLRGRSPS